MKRSWTSESPVTSHLTWRAWARVAAMVGLMSCRSPATPPPTWHDETHYRWRELPLAAGRTGFSVVDPKSSGIRFANEVPDSATTANRILAHGAGVAMGDVDGDGRTDIFLGRTVGRSALYRNLGNWQFEEVTEAAGLDA